MEAGRQFRECQSFKWARADSMKLGGDLLIFRLEFINLLDHFRLPIPDGRIHLQLQTCFNPVGKTLDRREGLPTPGFLAWQNSEMVDIAEGTGHSPWGDKSRTQLSS